VSIAKYSNVFAENYKTYLVIEPKSSIVTCLTVFQMTQVTFKVFELTITHSLPLFVALLDFETDEHASDPPLPGALSQNGQASCKGD